MPEGSQFAQFAGVILTAASFIGTALTQYVEHPGEKYEEKVKKLQKDRWSALSTELGELMVEVEEAVDNGGDSLQGAEERAGRFALIIQKEYDKSEFDDVFRQIEDVNTPKTLFKRAREARDNAWNRFLGALGCAILGLGMVFFLPSQQDLALVVFVVCGYAVLAGVNSGRRWQKTRQELDEMWEDYEYM